MNLPFPYQKQLHAQYETLRIAHGDIPAMKLIASAERLEYNDVKKAIKKAEKALNKKHIVKVSKKVKEFTGKPTAKECDALWTKAVLIRAGHKCEKENCRATKGIQAHHIIFRTNWSLRFDLENGIALCIPHHITGEDSAHKDAIGFSKWIATKRDLNYLESKRNNRAKLDYMVIKLYLENEIAKYRK